MIKYIKGDLFRSPAKILVNTVNTVGVMGKGVALELEKNLEYSHILVKVMFDEAVMYEDEISLLDATIL